LQHECNEQITRVLFAGPSLRHQAARMLPLDTQLLPPVQRGDLDRLEIIFPNVKAIGLVDGKFFDSFSLSPKEVLRSIDKGKLVFGSSTLGALRAAELSIYGMRGVGDVYNLFVSGDLDSDGEVLMNYDPVTLERRSEPMVDIRFALGRARREGRVRDWAAGLTIELAKQIYYSDRTCAAVLARVKEQLSTDDYAQIASALIESEKVTQADSSVLLETMGISKNEGQPIDGPSQDGYRSAFSPSTLDSISDRFRPNGFSHPPSLRKEVKTECLQSLPAPALRLPDLFTDVLVSRRSVRQYTERPLNLEEVSTFLYHSARVVTVSPDPELGDTALRPFPTAGARSELEVYLISEHISGLTAGGYYYDPFQHALMKLRDRDDHQARLLSAACSMMGDQSNRAPAAVLLITAVFDRTIWKYGDLGASLIYRDAGCFIQTCYLVATALKFAPCALGGDLNCSHWLRLDPGRERQVGCVLLGPASESSALPNISRSQVSLNTGQFPCI
jgi:SagB-type dehydrogenase family enzyme